MGKTVMRPRMKRGISIAAAVACSFTLIPAVNAVQGGGATANAVIANDKYPNISKVALVIENGESIFDNPVTLKKLKEMDKDAIYQGAGDETNTSSTHTKVRNLYKEIGVDLPYNSGGSGNRDSGYKLLAAHLDKTYETLYEEDGLGYGDSNEETYPKQPEVYVRYAGQKEFSRAAYYQFLSLIHI